MSPLNQNVLVFEELGLGSPQRRAIEDLGFVHPTPIQEKAFPVISSGKDMVGIAQTGTGKTFAYLLPLLSKLKYSEQRHPRILILVPTRELVVQVVGELEKLTTYQTVRICGIYGGTNINTQRATIYEGQDIIVATPGRLYDLAMIGILRFQSIQKLVIDEVDEMLDLGFLPQLESIFEQLPTRRQNIMLSATLTEKVDELIQNFFNEPVKVEVARHGTPLEKIQQFVYHVPNFFTKINLLEHLLNEDETMKKVLVFVDTKKLADRVEEKLQVLYPDEVGVIHSNKAQNTRLNLLKRFEDGENRILVATDIMARGLDISDVTHVINFDLTEEPADYIHRIGRTGRANQEGVALSFVNEVEVEYLDLIEEMMQKNVEVKEIPEDVQISNIFTEEERPTMHVRHFTPNTKRKGDDERGPAFHEKSLKNQKVNLGSPGSPARMKDRIAKKKNRRKKKKY